MRTMQYNHARACVDVGERLLDLGNEMTEPVKYAHLRMTISPDNADKLKALLMEIDNLIGDIYDADKQAREEAAREYDEYVKDNKLGKSDLL
ncbi:MAG: hypothetical protein AB1781_11100 [Pseudomonadota bacterium]